MTKERLLYTLTNLKREGISRFDMINHTKATAYLVNKVSITVYMAKDYIVGETAIVEAVSDEPYPDYIVYNEWDQVTDLAKEEAQRLNIPLLGYTEFRREIQRLVDAKR